MKNNCENSKLARPLRILYVFNVSWFFLSHRSHLAKAAQNAGYDVHVAAAPFGDDAVAIESTGMTFHPLPLARRGMNPLVEIKTLLSLFKLYLNLKPDLVEHATVKPVLYGSFVASFFYNLKVVNWMTGLGYIFISDKAKGAFLRSLITRIYRIIFHQSLLKIIFENPDDRNHFIDYRVIQAKKTVVIRGAGVDTNQFIPLPECSGSVMVVFPARMLWDKGANEFVDAARILKHEGVVDARFVMVGDSDDGNLTSISEDILKGWNEAGEVEWWGRRNDMASVFAKSHIICLPSYREGLPKVLVEAAAAGRAIVTTDVPGCREVVKDGYNGLLVPVKDSRALAAALRKLITDQKLREEMGAKGRTMALKEFSENKVIAETLTVYNELLKQ